MSHDILHIKSFTIFIDHVPTFAYFQESAFDAGIKIFSSLPLNIMCLVMKGYNLKQH